LISNSKGKAELLLDQFKSVFAKTTDNTLPKTRIQAKTDITPIKSSDRAEGYRKTIETSQPK